jgi:hypothetical protein
MTPSFLELRVLTKVFPFAMTMFKEVFDDCARLRVV